MEAEHDLLVRAQGGDPRAWDRLLELHGPYVLGLASNLMRRAGCGPAEADEVVQEVWLALLREDVRGLRGIDPARGMKPYLSTAVLNASRRWLRTRGRRRERDLSAVPPSRSPEAPDAAFLEREEASRLARILETLPSRERLILGWVYWEGLSYAQVASLLGISPNAVGPLLTRARSLVQEGLGKT